MYLIFALAFGLSRAEPTLTSRPARLTTMPRRENVAAEWPAYVESFRHYLRATALTSSAPDVAPMLGPLGRLSDLAIARSAIFATLAESDNGLSAREVVDLMMSGYFRESDGDRLRPASAFRLAMPDADDDVDKRQFEIFETLAARVDNIREWRGLAVRAANWTELAGLVSRALVSNLIETFRAWPRGTVPWREVLSWYRPDYIDGAECAAIVSNFESTHELLEAMLDVPEPQVRLCLQRAAVTRLARPSPGTVRTLLRPLGANADALQYRVSLARLERELLEGRDEVGCGPLFAATVNDDPRLARTFERSGDRRERPSFLRVIAGGLKDSP